MPRTRFEVLHEEAAIVVVAKPAGMLVAGDATGDLTLLARVREHLQSVRGTNEPPYVGLVHRLDRPVSGLMVFACTRAAAASLCEQFRSGELQKAYVAWVQGRPAASYGRLEHWLCKDRGKNVVRVVPASARNAQQALTDYEVLARRVDRTLLRLWPRTGRPHQLRVQLAAAGMPIVGDVKYGGPRLIRGQIALHAERLAFDHPEHLARVEFSLPAVAWNDSFARLSPRR